MLVISAIMVALVAVVILLQPSPIVRLVAKISPRVLFYVQTEERVVALTIDDGPDAVETSVILDVLKRYRAHATFFMIARNVSGNEALVKRMIQEDHEIGVHFPRFPPTVMYTPHQFDQALAQSAAIFGRFGPSTWFRPSSGWYNARMLDIAEKQGYGCVLASVHPHDSHVRSVTFATRFILAMISHGEIIALHDGEGRGLRTASVLERVLPSLQARGYEVTTVSALVRRSGIPNSIRSAPPEEP
jgi:peptidoglycan/xylan/chitin deacetylase (PgdA/CDA1 family)